MKNIISTDKAPQAIGPYSQAIEVNGMVFTSGVIPIIPATGELVTGGIEEQADQAIGNLKELLAASGVAMENVVKTTVCKIFHFSVPSSFLRGSSKITKRCSH